MSKEIDDIIKRLERQRDHIEEAILTLRRIDMDEIDRQPTSGATQKFSQNGTKKAVRKAVKRSRLSPEARERIAAAQRKRWAAQRKAAKKAIKKAG